MIRLWVVRDLSKTEERAYCGKSNEVILQEFVSNPTLLFSEANFGVSRDTDATSVDISDVCKPFRSLGD